jgi:2-methylcitrate dehydratase PrpD
VSALAAANWTLVNGRVLAVFGPVLILAGIAGFLVPPRLALMSGAPAYNVFHIVFGALGTALVVAKTATGIAAFNLGFGAADVYQAVAGIAGWFPARQFRYKPADHVLHVVLGLGLAAVGWMGLR